jgi:hypothetical protein
MSGFLDQYHSYLAEEAPSNRGTLMGRRHGIPMRSPVDGRAHAVAGIIV